MPWFVIRQSTGPQPRIFLHDEGYASRVAAEQDAWDNSRIKNTPTPDKPVDESVPPFIIDAADDREAIIEWARQYDRRLNLR